MAEVTDTTVVAQVAESATEAVKDIAENGLSSHVLSDITSYLIAFGKNVLVALLIYIVGRYIIKRITSLVCKLMTKRQVEPSLFSFASSLVKIVLYFVMIIAIISVLGIETSSFVALFASAGVAIGMALSGTLQNFAGGVMILLFRPFKVGDVIEAQGFTGGVKEIQIFNTILLTPDNQTIIIPNGGLSTGNIRNYSRQPRRRVDIDVEVAYGTKPEDVRKVLTAICNADPRILKEAGFETTMPMTTMSASSIIFNLRVWTESSNYFDVLFDTTESVYKELAAAGIEIPYQQLDVHLRNN